MAVAVVGTVIAVLLVGRAVVVAVIVRGDVVAADGEGRVVKPVRLDMSTLPLAEAVATSSTLLG